MIGFFEVISTSAPHIYHSALPQSPQTSTIRKLYEPYAHPLARVVQGIPISWEPAVATVDHRRDISALTWSPCSRYITVSHDDPPTIKILDAATLEQLHTFKPRSAGRWLSISSESRLLTQFSRDHEVTTWDLQTGGRISTIPPTSHMGPNYFSSTYSIDGKMVAVAYLDPHNGSASTGISTYNLLSGTHMYSHHILEEERVVASIWTHGECLRFVTLKPSTITVWQVGFASIDTLAKVESFPTPANISYLVNALFLPTRSLFAFAGLGIWDVQDSKFLLKIQSREFFPIISISFDGRFFVYQDDHAGIDIWEESPAGYVHRRKLVPDRVYSSVPLSPNGKSIITTESRETRLWRTTDPIAFLSSFPTGLIGSWDFHLDFSPDGSLAVTAWRDDTMVTVVDLKSGNPRLIVDTGMPIYGLWVTGNTITVFDGRRIVAWKLPGGDHVLDAKATIDDSVRTITLDWHPIPNSRWRKTKAISCHLNCIVTFSWVGIEEPYYRLDIHDMSTGNHLVGVITQDMHTMWITPDGCGVRFLSPEGHARGWEIVGGEGSSVIGLEPLPDNTCSSGGNPLESPHGCCVTDDGWIFNSRKERLMWLPHRWRGYTEGRKWDGRFLGLLYNQLPEPIIIEFDE